MMIYENNDLQALWKPRANFEILNGSMFFHSNSKLCPSVIQDFLNATQLTKNYTDAFIVNETNGKRFACNSRLIKANHRVDSPTNVTIFWEPFQPSPGDKLVGYMIHYIEAKFKNITHYYATEDCSL